MLPPFEWPTAVDTLPSISRFENRSIRALVPDGNGCRVLLKCLAPPFDAGEAALFANEFLLLQRLRHPNWVEVGGFRKLPDGTHVIAMAEAAGTPLAELPLQPGWSPHKAAIANQILSGLDAVHRMGYVHGDLKPEHIYIEGLTEGLDGIPKVKLLDLGLASRLGEVACRGTVDRMPPEILQREAPWSIASDLYLFGLVLFRLAYAEEPFSTTESIEQRILERLRGEVVLDNPAVHHRLRQIIPLLIARNPEHRLGSCRDVWRDLREVLVLESLDRPEPALQPFEKLPLCGRTDECARFVNWIRELATLEDRITAACAIRGEPGIGKSALIDEFVAIAQTEGWIQEPGTFAAGSSCDLRAQRGSVRLEIRERLSIATDDDGESHPGPWPSAGDSRVPIRMDVPLEPLSATTMRTLARMRFEDLELSDRVAHLALGNPRLLEAACAATTWLVEFAWREFPDAVRDRPPEAGPAPTAWIQWLQGNEKSHGPAGLESLALAAISRYWRPETIAEHYGREWNSVLADLEPFYRRGLVRDEGGHPQLLCSAWEDAAIRASGEPVRQLLAALMRHTDKTRSASELVVLVNLGVTLGCLEELAPLFERTIRALHAEEQFEAEQAFLLRTLRSLPPEVDLFTPDLWRLVAEMIVRVHFGMVGDSSSWVLTDPPPPSMPSSLAPVFRAWTLNAADRRAEGLEALGPPDRFPDGAPPSLVWISVYFACHGRKDIKEEQQERLRRWIAHPRFAGREEQLRLRLLEAYQISHLTTPEELLRRIALIDLPRGSLSTEASLRLLRASAYFNLGRLQEAHADMEIALRNLQATNGISLLRLAIQLASALGYEGGDLRTAYLESRRVVRFSLLYGKETECAQHLRNLILVEYQRGQLGMALASYQNAEEISARLQQPDPGRRGRWLGLAIRWRVGDESVVGELRAQLESGLVLEGHLRGILGLQELGIGSLEEGRRQLRQAITDLDESGQTDAGIDTTADWLETEIDLGERAIAESLLIEIQNRSAQITGRQRARLRVVEAAMLVEGWLEVARDVERVLLDLVIDIRRRDFGLYFWRSHWHLARFYWDSERFPEASDQYRAARSFAEDLIATVENEKFRRCLRDRPGVKRFWTEMASRTLEE